MAAIVVSPILIGVYGGVVASEVEVPTPTS